VRWLIALPFKRAGFMGVDFAEELAAMGHEVRMFEYRRDNIVYKNRSTKAAYQLVILRRFDRFVNYFPDNPLWMIPFECIEAYDVFFTKERYAMASLQQVGLRNLHYLPMYCVPSLHHPVTLSAEEARRFSGPASGSSARWPITRCGCGGTAGRDRRTPSCDGWSPAVPCTAARSWPSTPAPRSR
jgi:hypothetical protein